MPSDIVRGDQGGGSSSTGIDPTGLRDHLQEGVLVATDCAATLNSITQITVAAAPHIYIRNTSGSLAPVIVGQTTVLSGIPAATNNRLDQIVVDSSGTVSRLAGTSDLAGNTLTNRTGAAAIPTGSLLLHDILVTNGGVLAANMRDRRPWARGFFFHSLIATQTRTGSSPGVQLVTGTRQRVECSGNPIRVCLAGRADSNSTWSAFRLYIDGADSVAEGDKTSGAPASGAVLFEGTIIPSAGSHLFEIQTTNGGGSLSCTLAGNNPFTIEEKIRQNASNGTN